MSDTQLNIFATRENWLANIFRAGYCFTVGGYDGPRHPGWGPGVFTSDPQPIPGFTVEELKEKGLVGVYKPS